MIRFDNVPPEIMQAMCTPMHQVLPSTPVTVPSRTSPSSMTTISSGALYIGSISAIHDVDLLRSHNVSHLVQVLDAPWLPPLGEKEGFTSFKISILDATSADLKPYLENACTSIDRALREGRSVLVHCQQGVSRSAAVVIAYLIRNHGMSYDVAYNHLLRKRACIKPNSGFVNALKDWENTWRRPSLGQRRFTS
ncbi:phosphatases II [Dendrothele bispora CBS 962.96]|uniref:protein-tyrosine-phosphatase n=1 Tax=Dendrothele bispora (strain CBS 962.96) TaxID=1314807 RepID=A0A4S8LV69_DENBC|nr:phosphatases II [Dendrothele bispora CBS 962.96]